MRILFEHLEFFWFFFVVPLIIILHFYTLKKVKAKALAFANFDAIARVTGKQVFTKNLVPLYLRVSAFVLIVLALASPIFEYVTSQASADYVLAIDSSSSMLANDYNPNRFMAAKEAAKSFVNLVPEGTKIGIVSFAGTSFVELGMQELKSEIIGAIDMISIKEVGGTDIGSSLISAANLLEQAKKAKVIILLTDGRSNVGIQPEDAVDYANKKNVVIHAIGIGTKEGGTFEGLDIVSTVDEETLQSIANSTSGRYYRAISQEEIAAAYQNIVQQGQYKRLLYATPYILALAFFLLFFEWFLVNTKFRLIP